MWGFKFVIIGPYLKIPFLNSLKSTKSLQITNIVLLPNLILQPYAPTIFTDRNQTQTSNISYNSVEGVNAYTVEIRPWSEMILGTILYSLHQKHTTSVITSSDLQSETFHHNSKDHLIDSVQPC